jgi:AcrR family transcriptional regulator
MDNGSMGLRDRKKLQTRAALTKAAIELFTANGYDATTVEDIAARAEVSPMTFFNYFGSKDAVLFSERDQHKTRFCQALLARPLDEDEFTAGRAAAREAFDGNDDHWEMERIRLLEASVSAEPVIAGRFYRFRREWEDEIAQTLAKRRRGDSSALEFRLAASLVMGAISLATRVWHETSSKKSPAQMIDEMFERLIDSYPRAVDTSQERESSERKARS